MSYPLGIMEGMTREAERAENHKDVTIRGACEARPVRRVVHCDGIRGVLERRDGRWSIQNESEARVLASLGGSSRGFDRLQAVTATLDAGLIDTEGVTYFSNRLRAISHAENMCRVWIPDQLLPMVAFACAFMPASNGARWLAWALSARLDSNLSRRVLPGPGWCTLTRYQQLSPWGYDREIRWISEMPQLFWDRLAVRQECCPRSGPTDICLSSGEGPCLRSVSAASDPSTDPEVLTELAQSRDSVVLDLVASHPKTPADVLCSIVESWQMEQHVRLRVTQNRSAPTWLLRRMAENSLWQVRGLAAMNEGMPAEVLEELCGDDMLFVRSAVAGHESTPDEELRILACDHESSVRRAVAANGACPADLLERLLADKKWQVRSAVVSNPAASLELVAHSADDRAMGVRAAVAYRSDAPGDVLRALAQDGKAKVRRAVAWNDNAPPDALESLAAASEPHIRYPVGLHASTPTTVLAAMAADSESWTRSSVARNANTPAEWLEAMAADDDSDVRQAVAGNLATPTASLTALASDDRFWVRIAAAANASTPEQALRSLATDEHEEVRIAAARNPSIPDELLEALISDEDYRARAEAAENLKKRREPQESTEPQEKGIEER